MTEENQQLPDLEIYVEGGDIEAMVAWIQTVFEDSNINNQNKQGAKLTCNYQDETFPVVIVKNAGSTGFSSIWFDTRLLPWEDDLACAKAAYEALEKTVRCIESVWVNGDDPDRWFEYSTDGEKIINLG